MILLLLSITLHRSSMIVNIRGWILGVFNKPFVDLIGMNVTYPRTQ